MLVGFCEVLQTSTFRVFSVASGRPSIPVGKTKEEIMMNQTGMLIVGFLFLATGALANPKVTNAIILAGESSGPEGSPVEFRPAMLESSARPNTERISRKNAKKDNLLFHPAKQTNTNARECYPHVSYAITLANTLGQVKHVNGLDIRGDHQMEIYVNPKTLTWTLVLIIPSGLACKIGNGTEILIEPLPLGM